MLMEADSIEGIRTFARSGLGVGIRPDFAVRSMVQEGALERVRIEGFTPAVESALFCHPVKWMSARHGGVFAAVRGAGEGRLSKNSKNH